MSGEAWTDHRIETAIGTLLRIGVGLAALMVTLGGAIFLLRHGTEPPPWRVYHGVPGEFCSFRGIVGEVQAGSGRGMIQLGILFLIATPVMRVAFMLAAFRLQRDRLYIALSALVLGILLVGWFLNGH